MKKQKKKYLLLILITIISFLTITLNVNAISLPMLEVTSGNYSNGDRFTRDGSKTISLGATLQLHAIKIVGNDFCPDDINACGWYVSETNLSGVSWSSSNAGVATVSNTGVVTGVRDGNATITAWFENETDTFEVTVNSEDPTPVSESKIEFARLTPVPTNVLNLDRGFLLNLRNIPDTEKKNIRFTIEDESIAKVVNVNLYNEGEDNWEGVVVVNVKFLALGSTTINATLNYNGKTYTDSYDFDVVESAKYISLSTKDDTDLPSSIAPGETVQLKAMFNVRGGSLLPKDVTNTVTWTSSDTKVVKVDDKGLVTAVGPGTAIITGNYNDNGETVTVTYIINVKGDAVAPVDNKIDNPNTGVLEIGILSVILISVISGLLLIKNKKYNRFRKL